MISEAGGSNGPRMEGHGGEAPFSELLRQRNSHQYVGSFCLAVGTPPVVESTILSAHRQFVFPVDKKSSHLRAKKKKQKKHTHTHSHTQWEAYRKANVSPTNSGEPVPVTRDHYNARRLGC